MIEEKKPGESEKLKGMRELNPAEIQAMNEVAELGNQFGELLERFESPYEEYFENIDQRWLSIGRTQIQQGIMAVKRAIGRPENF